MLRQLSWAEGNGACGSCIHALKDLLNSRLRLGLLIHVGVGKGLVGDNLLRLLVVACVLPLRVLELLVLVVVLHSNDIK